MAILCVFSATAYGSVAAPPPPPKKVRKTVAAPPPPPLVEDDDEPLNLGEEVLEEQKIAEEARVLAEEVPEEPVVEEAPKKTEYVDIPPPAYTSRVLEEDDPDKERLDLIKDITKGMEYPPNEGAWIYGGLDFHQETGFTLQDCHKWCEETTACLHYTWQLGNDGCQLHQEGGGFDDSKIGFLCGHSSRWRKRKTEL